jgi:hypothetical protein
MRNTIRMNSAAIHRVAALLNRGTGDRMVLQTLLPDVRRQRENGLLGCVGGDDANEPDRTLAFRENLRNLMSSQNVIPLSIVLSSEVHASMERVMNIFYIIGVVVVIIIVAGFLGLHV